METTVKSKNGNWQNRSLYDDIMFRDLSQEYYGQSGFYNWGYWLEDTRDQKEACENLVEKLLAFIPDKRGCILDVACGMGATTRYLHRYYDPSRVVGINISDKQLARSTANAPGSSFLVMDATKLAFEDGLFDNMLCVEASFHFDTRAMFLQEASRVLKPDGCLALSDITIAKVPKRRRDYFPEGNFVKDLEEYQETYLRAGFQTVQITDATNECWLAFRRHLMGWGYRKLLERKIGLARFAKAVLWYLGAGIMIKHYLLVSAHKG